MQPWSVRDRLLLLCLAPRPLPRCRRCTPRLAGALPFCHGRLAVASFAVAESAEQNHMGVISTLIHCSGFISMIPGRKPLYRTIL